MKRILYKLWHDEGGFWNLLIPIASAVGSLFGGASQARSGAKQAQNQTALQQYQAELAAKIAQQQGASQRAQDIRTAGGSRMKDQLLANMMAGGQLTRISHPRATIPQISGGPPPLSDATRAQAGLLSQDALMRQMQGQNAPDISPVLGLPNAPQMAKSSWLDKLLGIGGMAGGLIGGIGGAVQQGQAPVPGSGGPAIGPEIRNVPQPGVPPSLMPPGPTGAGFNPYATMWNQLFGNGPR